MRDLRAIFGVDFEKHLPKVSKKAIKELTRDIPKRRISLTVFMEEK